MKIHVHCNFSDFLSINVYDFCNFSETFWVSMFIIYKNQLHWFIKGHNLFFVCMCSLHFTAACQPLNFVIYTTIVCVYLLEFIYNIYNIIRHTVTQTLVLQMHIVMCVEKKRSVELPPWWYQKPSQLHTSLQENI